MFESKPARPNPGAEVFEGFWLPDSLERFSHCGLHKIEKPERCASVGLYPEAQVLAKLLLEDCGPNARWRHLLRLREAELLAQGLDGPR